MFEIFSPNMLKTFQQCPKKFYFRYVEKISMPMDDTIFEFGKNIHALASYYLKKENIDKIELALSPNERKVWEYLKTSKYFSYELVGAEYNLSVKVGNNFFGGRLDALVKYDDEYYILDYKTGTVPKNAKFDFQTMIYILAVKEFFKTNKINFVYIDLKNKDEVIIKYTPELEEEYKGALLNIIEQIDKYEKCASKKDCNCEYSLICY